MKVLVVPDLHGRRESCHLAIKKFEDEQFSKIIFLADYCDSYDRNTEDMLDIIRMILNAKERWDDKVVALIGNHELHYMYEDEEENYRCSGFRADRKAVLYPVLNANKDLFKVAYQINKGEKRYLFTHAGVCKKWFQVNKENFERFNVRFKDETPDPDNLADYLNRINQTSFRTFLHQVGRARGGMWPCGGITWCDDGEIMQYNPLEGYHHVVGHTPQKFRRRVDKFNGSHYNNTSVTFCDVLGNSMDDFYELEI